MCSLVTGSQTFFFVKQKTADEMRISDWSSDVCSSDLFLVRIGDAAFVPWPDRGRVRQIIPMRGDMLCRRFAEHETFEQRIGREAVGAVQQIGSASWRERVGQ